MALNQELFEQIAGRAWMADDIRLPNTVLSVPSMLSDEERRMLSWVARHRADFDAPVCDLGAFLGGSTVSLAHGIQTSEKITKLHTFDRFIMREKAKKKWLYPRGEPPFVGDSVLHVVQRYLSPFAPFVEYHVGDVVEKKWTGQSVSILFIDISKSWDINDFLIRQFFPYLLPNAIIIQQDFFFHTTPWLHSTMHKLRDKIIYAGATQKYSAIYMVKEPPSGSELERCLHQNTTDKEVSIAIDTLLAEFQGDTVHLAALEKLKKAHQLVPNALSARQLSVIGRRSRATGSRA